MKSSEPKPEPSKAWSWTFTNRFLQALPADPSSDPHPRQVHGAAYSNVQPTPVKAPKLIAHAQEVASLLDLSPIAFEDAALVRVLAGNEVRAGMQPSASCYGGHQFGHWAGQLGDGRAITLGEIQNSRGDYYEVQLKGAGPTPYSRRGDGRAVLRSSVREFLCSEAMFHLGIPTTRALSLINTGEHILRDMFYDGNPGMEQGAIVCRVAPSFIRFGHFELFAARNDVGNLKKLADFTLNHYFSARPKPTNEDYVAMLKVVAEKTARMVVEWMRVGFVHGVLNTDNMSILGLTIDYGPYGWLEPYDPHWTPNTTDAQGRRYAFAKQPHVAAWNLARLAQSFVVLGCDEAALDEALEHYTHVFNEAYPAMLASKLGWQEFRDGDDALVQNLFSLLAEEEIDMTLFFRNLSDSEFMVAGKTPKPERDDTLEPWQLAYYDAQKSRGPHAQKMQTWLEQYRKRCLDDPTFLVDGRKRMLGANPKYVLRNYLAQVVIDDVAEGDFTSIAELLDTLKRPYDDQPGREKWAQLRPEWARNKPGCSMLSCSS
jgi:serine/tyrosine/threonine adenylyltransferase